MKRLQIQGQHRNYGSRLRLAWGIVTFPSRILINSFAFLTPNKHDFISERSPYPPAPLSLGLSNPKALLNHRRVAWSGHRGSSSRAVLKLRAIPPPPSVSPEPELSRGGAKAERGEEEGENC
ncbi:hypothetical protein SRHO_G00157380 [Serrasalmus rhombeus]